ncbi:hypothetical protein OIU76_011702 [Salix suchowensis]|nr:hypothetical protein OIU76_011702 [Salix suchowensis]
MTVMIITTRLQLQQKRIIMRLLVLAGVLILLFHHYLSHRMLLTSRMLLFLPQHLPICFTRLGFHLDVLTQFLHPLRWEIRYLHLFWSSSKAYLNIDGIEWQYGNQRIGFFLVLCKRSIVYLFIKEVDSFFLFGVYVRSPHSVLSYLQN